MRWKPKALAAPPPQQWEEESFAPSLPAASCNKVLNAKKDSWANLLWAQGRATCTVAELSLFKAEALRESMKSEFDAHDVCPELAAMASSAPTFLCTRHWAPVEGVVGCLSVLHGDRFVVVWRDDAEDGWCWCVSTEDPSRAGYVPFPVLRPLDQGHFQPRLQIVGSLCCVDATFQVPAKNGQRIGGYIAVEQGDIVEVLHHDLSEAKDWVYAEVAMSSSGETAARGWVPEAVLRQAARPYPPKCHGELQNGCAFPFSDDNSAVMDLLVKTRPLAEGGMSAVVLSALAGAQVAAA